MSTTTGARREQAVPYGAAPAGSAGQGGRGQRRRTRRRWRPGVGRALMVAFLLSWSLGPVVIGVLTSISTQRDVSSTPTHLLPSAPTLSAYRSLLGGATAGGAVAAGTVSTDETGAFRGAVLNAAVSTSLTVVVVLAVAVTAGYAFSRLRFAGSRVVLVTAIATLAVPVVAVLVPLFQLLAGARLIDTQLGLVLVYSSATAPLAVWLFFNYCQDVSTDPEEAALLDGCNRWQALRHVVVPQLVPGIAALTAIVMLAVWGQFLIPLLFAPTAHTKPVSVLVTEFSGKYRTDYPLVAAAGVLALVPPAVVASVLNRSIRSMLGTASV